MSDKKQLGFFSITVITVSLVVGMGIFKLPAIVAAKSGSSAIFFLAWIISGIVTLMGAVIFSKLGNLIPETGAYYKIFSISYHPSIAFTINILILVSNAATVGIITLIGVDYLSDLLFRHPITNTMSTVCAICCITFFYLINLMGLRSSSKTQNILMIIKISVVLFLIFSLFSNVKVEPHGYELGKVYSLDEYKPFTLLMFSLVSISFICGGYQQTINFGGEVKNKFILERGIIIGTSVAMVLYLFLNITYVYVIGFEKMKNATAIASLLCEALFSKQGALIFDIVMLISVMAYVNVLLLSNPRVIYAMSINNILPSVFSFRHKKTGSLVVSLTFFASVAVLVVFLGKGIDNILSFSMFLDSIGFIFSAGSLLMLLKKKLDRIPATYLILSFFFAAFYLLVLMAVIIEKPMAAFFALCLFSFFVTLFFITQFFKSKS